MLTRTTHVTFHLFTSFPLRLPACSPVLRAALASTHASPAGVTWPACAPPARQGPAEPRATPAVLRRRPFPPRSPERAPSPTRLPADPPIRRSAAGRCPISCVRCPAATTTPHAAACRSAWPFVAKDAAAAVRAYLSGTSCSNTRQASTQPSPPTQRTP